MSDTNIEQMKADLIADLFGNCTSDGNFLWEVLAEYVDTYSEEKVVQLHKELYEEE